MNKNIIKKIIAYAIIATITLCVNMVAAIAILAIDNIGLGCAIAFILMLMLVIIFDNIKIRL